MPSGQEKGSPGKNYEDDSHLIRNFTTEDPGTYADFYRKIQFFPKESKIKNRRVVLVDDNFDILETLALALVEEGYEVTAFYFFEYKPILRGPEPDELIKIAEEILASQPAVVILDARLGVTHGTDLARTIKRLSLAQTPIIMNAGLDPTEAMYNISPYYLAKPYILEKMLELVAEIAK